MKRILLIFALMLSIIPSFSFGASDNVYVIEISGEVNPGMLNYVRENIEDANILSPIISEDLFETAQHDNNLESYEKEGIDENGENKTIYQDVQIDKFKETLENIINKRPQNQNTDSNDTTFDSNNIN